MRNTIRKISVLLFFLLALTGCDTTSGPAPTGKSGNTFKLYQLPTITDEQCLSYIIETESGEVAVVDGGRYEDYAYLYAILEWAEIDRVDAWFITHVHFDHFGALVQMLEKNIALEIGEIYGSIPDRDWIQARLDEDGSRVDAGNVHHYNRFLDAIEDAGRSVKELRVQDIEVGGITFEILRVWNPEIHKDAINNSCVVIRVTDSVNSVLFLGDLVYEASVEIATEEITPGIAERIKSDFVQIAHHGVDGVSPGFYTLVDPEYTLWPTPMFLYGPEPHHNTPVIKRELEMIGVGEDERFVSGRDGLTIFQFTIPQSLPGVTYMENSDE